MKRMLGPHDCVTEITIGGRDYKRQSDGTFHIPDGVSSYLRKQSGGDMTLGGVPVSSGADGYRCECGHLSVFTTCKCGRENLAPEQSQYATTIGPLGIPPTGVKVDA